MYTAGRTWKAQALTADRSPESDLLVACGRPDQGKEGKERLRALAGRGIDWGLWLAACHRHRTTALAFKALSGSCADLAPPPALEQLRSYYRANSLRNLGMQRELVRIVQALEKSGVPALPYKGPALATMAYGDAGLRNYVDLDILIRPADVARAEQALVGLGYNLTDECRRHAEAYRQAHHHIVMTLPASKTLIEVHWRLVTRRFRFDLSFAELWQRRQPVDFLGRQVSALAPEDMLLVACVHSSLHGWQRLYEVCDVAGLVERYPALDWQSLAERARRLGAERMLLLGLALAETLLGVRIPAGCAAAIAHDEVLPALQAQVQADLASVAAERAAEDTERSVMRYQIRLRERRRDRLDAFLRLLFIPDLQEWETTALPRFATPVRYLLRPLRFARRMAPILLRKLRS